jgi:hypothetical protein
MCGCSVSSSLLLLTASTNVAYHWVGRSCRQLSISSHLFFLFPFLTYHLLVDGSFVLHFHHVSWCCLEQIARVCKAEVGLRLCRHPIPANTDSRIPFQHLTQRQQQHQPVQLFHSQSVVTPSLYSATILTPLRRLRSLSLSPHVRTRACAGDARHRQRPGELSLQHVKLES